jgi:YbbR domain-containing protein
MSRWITGNLGLMALALVLAIVVWLFNTLRSDPIVEGTLRARVIVDGVQAPNLVLNTELPESVTVNVRAPRSTLNQLEQSPDSARVEVNLARLDSGRHVLPLRPLIAADTVAIVSSSPTTASVSLERLIERDAPVRISVIGVPLLGFERESEAIDLKSVTISGTESSLAKVTDVVAEISVEDLRASIAQSVRLQARDAQGEPVAGIRITPAEARAEVEIRRLANYRDFPVRVRLQGNPARDYSIVSITSNPQVITLFGDEDDIKGLPDFIETLPIDIDGATDSLDQRVGLNLPAGNVTVIGGAEALAVQVRVRVEAQQGASTVSRQPVLSGIDISKFSAVITPPAVDIVLSGPLPKLNQIRTDDVKVLLDLTDLGEGIHQVTPQVVRPDGIVAQLTASVVQVEILPVRDERQ